jgi:hypothetical protein
MPQLREAGRPRVVFEDPYLPHQIVITVRTGFNLAVSCNCRWISGSGHKPAYEPLEVRYNFPASEAIAVWRKHMADAGEPAA